jgi:hypothetical protein
MNQVFQQVWIALPKDVRNHLAEVFSLNRTGVTEIIDQTVKSDGYSNDDLKRISLENMCQYIGSQETFLRAWEITLAKVHSELHPIVGVIGGGIPEEKVLEPEVVFPTPITEVDLLKVDDTIQKEVVVKKSFCDKCDSKGHFHKQGCPNRN